MDWVQTNQEYLQGLYTASAQLVSKKYNQMRLFMKTYASYTIKLYHFFIIRPYLHQKLSFNCF